MNVNPITPLREKRPGEEGGQVRNPIDSKVRGLVLERISQARGGLLPAAMAPQILLDLLPALESLHMEHRPRTKQKMRKVPLLRGIPIGLLSSDSEGWVNALMQFILFIPGFTDLFFFAPRSFYSFREFIDQYQSDQQQNKNPSSANGIALFRFLTFRVPDLGLHEVFQFLLRALHAKWIIHPHLKGALQTDFPTDLFVIANGMKWQLFPEPKLFCYDLDAFIELRPDGPSVNFIAYVKVQGAWYQCDDEQITLLRSNCLQAPLYRSVLSHYRRLTFGKE